MKFLKLAVLLASFAIVPTGFANSDGDLVPLWISLSSNGVGEFPTKQGKIYVKNIGNIPVKYVGPDTCYNNPFGPGQFCSHVVTHKIGGLWSWTEGADTQIVINPGATVALPFYTEVSYVPFHHCQLVPVELDVGKTFNQTPFLKNYQDDVQLLFIHIAGNNLRCP
ncbi:hypothetical protein THII_0494 [Thioploca ingrica]|uniref:Uncharacterized protein n=1 Tax=Thioploca ingrica TaxID=40754 RepID=A0A090BUB0_9GAMM|nr:hypothetical protein THII_0494 [Thioploca ingrica]